MKTFTNIKKRLSALARRLVRRFPFRIVGVTGQGYTKIPKNHPARGELAEQRTHMRRLEEALDWAELIICNAVPMNHTSQEEWNNMVRRWRDEKHALWPEYIRLSQGDETEQKYHELLYAVASKHDGETRHETALRYIREREERIEGPCAPTPNQ